ncbi:hypothetical protein Ddc_15283 [Ditylenchus destructor]|nr:hypothetical protein Ddc_15283 [Ditylenchus destructor]
MSKRQNALSLDEKQKIIEAAEQNSNKSDKCGFTGAGLSDYIDMDQNLATAGTPTIEEIVENIRNEEESDEESEDDVIEIQASPESTSRITQEIRQYSPQVTIWRNSLPVSV